MKNIQILFITLVTAGLLTVTAYAADNTTSTQAKGLIAALQAVMQNNPAVKGKQAELAAESFGVDTAKAQRLPRLSLKANNLNRNFDQGTLSVEQPVWAFGKIDASIAQAKAKHDTECWSLLLVQRNLLEETAVAYARLEGIRQRNDVAQKNIIQHEELHSHIERRQQGQLASQADVRLAYSRLLQARTRSQRIQGELQIAQTELQTLTQVAIDSTLPVKDSLAALAVYDDVSGVLSDKRINRFQVETLILKNSANILHKKSRLKVVRLDVKKAKLASMPTVYFRAEHDVLDTIGGERETRYGFSMQASLDGSGFSARGRIKGAAARLTAAEFEVGVAQNDERNRVAKFLQNLQVQRDIYLTQALSVEAVEATMESFLRQYKTGRKSWVEVLNTQRELTELRLQLEQLKNEALLLSLRLAVLTGGLDEAAGLMRL